MKIEDFTSGRYLQQYEYKSFSPSLINLEWVLDDPDLIDLLSKADRYLGELNAFSQLVPDIDYFIQMHVTKEATTSSRIEGTRTNMEEAFIREEDIHPEKRDDWEEVQNYVKAMNTAIEELETLPFSNRLLKHAHHTLLQGVRGKDKLPGEFRVSQNWIGASLKNANYIPPYHEEIVDLMSDMELFLNNQGIKVPHLIRIALAHYQFETIHPFLDGNGRLGRLMITLYLVSNNVLVKPTLYLSDYFERNKGQYYDHLNGVRTRNDLKSWFKFFFEGMIEISKNSVETFREIIKLKEEVEMETLPKIGTSGKLKKARDLVKYMYSSPIVSLMEVSEVLSVSFATANRLVSDMVRLGVLVEVTGHKRNRIFAFKNYLNIFN